LLQIVEGDTRNQNTGSVRAVGKDAACAGLAGRLAALDAALEPLAAGDRKGSSSLADDPEALVAIEDDVVSANRVATFGGA
jgi:hypothetical protein